ncbi:MAG: GntR family transcriptional regulator [Nitrospirota bacterium]
MIGETVDRDSQQKLYVQIYSIIRGKIEKGEWPGGVQIPTEDELCRTYDVSKATIRIAIAELVRDGYLKRQQGKGTFVTPSTPHLGVAMKTRLTEDMFGEGVKTERELLARGVMESTEDVTPYLGAAEAIYYILCKRMVEGEPAYIEESFIPLPMFPGIEDEDICRTSFYDLIQEKAVRKIYKVIQTIGVTELRGNVADILRVPENAPGLLLHRLLIGSDGTPIAYTRLYGSGTKYKIQTEFERIKGH